MGWLKMMRVIQRNKLPGKCKAVVSCSASKVCKCGSTSHVCITHKDCPLKPKSKLVTGSQLIVQDIDDSDLEDEPFISESGSDMDSDTDDFTCPCNPRFSHQLVSNIVPDEIITGIVSTVSQDVPCDLTHNQIARSTGDEVNIMSILLRTLFSELSEENTPSTVNRKDSINEAEIHQSKKNKLKRKDSVKETEIPLNKKQKFSEELEVGSYILYLHSRMFEKHHHFCRIIETLGKLFRFGCSSGILTNCFSGDELIPLSGSRLISLLNWRLLPRLSLSIVSSDPSNVEKCQCKINPVFVDLTDHSADPVVASYTR